MIPWCANTGPHFFWCVTFRATGVVCTTVLVLVKFKKRSLLLHNVRVLYIIYTWFMLRELLYIYIYIYTLFKSDPLLEFSGKYSLSKLIQYNKKKDCTTLFLHQSFQREEQRKKVFFFLEFGKTKCMNMFGQETSKSKAVTLTFALLNDESNLQNDKKKLFVCTCM